IFFLLICMSTMIVICIAVGFFGQNKEDIIINRIVGIVAIISGIGSVIMGISSIFTSSLDNVREYYATGDTEKMVDARKVLYNYRYIKIKYGKTISDDDFDKWIKENIETSQTVLSSTTKQEIQSAASVVADFFQMWGLLQNKGFLPIWVFETASGYSIIKLYEAIDDIVIQARATNPFYAGQFQNLCIRINSKYRKAILECRKREIEYMRQKLGIKDVSNNRYFNNLIK
ncbi:MAG: hypothetical protein J6V22_06715, partial [Clostridia bacterium]|nr:hypothetical protein [Clostridia bacterium]